MRRRGELDKAWEGLAGVMQQRLELWWRTTGEARAGELGLGAMVANDGRSSGSVLAVMEWAPPWSRGCARGESGEAAFGWSRTGAGKARRGRASLG